MFFLALTLLITFLIFTFIYRKKCIYQRPAWLRCGTQNTPKDGGGGENPQQPKDNRDIEARTPQNDAIDPPQHGRDRNEGTRPTTPSSHDDNRNGGTRNDGVRNGGTPPAVTPQHDHNRNGDGTPNADASDMRTPRINWADRGRGRGRRQTGRGKTTTAPKLPLQPSTHSSTPKLHWRTTEPGAFPPGYGHGRGRQLDPPGE